MERTAIAVGAMQAWGGVEMRSGHRLQAFRRLALSIGLFVLPFAAQAVTFNAAAAAGTGAWTPAGDMLVARRDHTATLLPNGKVLVVGWFTNTAELYDPATNAFAATGSTLDAHGQGSTATRLPDGKVLIVGGNGAPTSAELFDPATGAFSRAGNPNSPRIFHAATALSDGRVLVAGGQGNSAEIYAPATNRFTSTGGLNTSRSGAAAALLPDGSVLIAGGASDAAGCLATAELFNPLTGTFSLTGSLVGMGCTLWWNQIAVLPNGHVFVVGGSDQANIFDPASGTFHATTGHMTVRRTAPAAILLGNGQVLVTGGSIAAGPVDTNSADLYDPSTDSFAATASMSTPRQQFTITRLLNGHVLVTGGFTGVEDHTRSAELFSLGDQPITANGTTISPTEGKPFTATVATFTDPDTSATAAEYAAAINWGDGSSSAGTISGGTGNFAVSGTHTYAEEGQYHLTVTVTDIDNPSNSATAKSTANVSDAALTASPACLTTSPQSYNGPTATFTDAATPFGTLSDFRATINWGDGTFTAGLVTGPNGGPYAVSGSHTYLTTGTFTITTAIRDVGSKAFTSCKTLAFSFAPGGGSFVIGDKNAVPSNSITFWGAQWAKDNSLSGGSAPRSFKGFAENPTTPSCGAGWSADPGNSTPPPDGPLPAFMGVIVTSSADKSGSTISGNTLQIVIVQTNPGYAPDPGHAGTGTVVAVVVVC